MATGGGENRRWPESRGGQRGYPDGRPKNDNEGPDPRPV